jgi:hypothetical protein
MLSEHTYNLINAVCIADSFALHEAFPEVRIDSVHHTIMCLLYLRLQRTVS